MTISVPNVTKYYQNTNILARPINQYIYTTLHKFGASKFFFFGFFFKNLKFFYSA